MPLQIFHSEMSRRSTALQTLAAAIVISGCSFAAGQTATNSTAPTGSIASNSDPSPNSKTWIVRDPVTGRLFQQRLVPVSVPVTRWEAKTVEQTVYEPQVTTNVQHAPQTLFVPKTQYVMQPKVRGWWNPLKPPVQAYEYTPVTQWVPQTQSVPQAVTTPQWVPKPQKIVVYQPVQSTEIRQQLVQVELPQPQYATNQALSGSAPAYLPPQSVSSSSGLRPITPTFPAIPPIPLPRFATRPYNAPLRPVTSGTSSYTRDTIQSGMQPTVLR